MNKRFTEKTAAAVCKKLLKTVPDSRKQYKTGWTNAAGKACFCDGFRAYMLNAAPDGVPMTEDGASRIDLSKAFAPLESGKVAEMPAPDPDAVRAFIKETGGGRGPYDLGEFLPVVNPEYISDILRLFPGAKWYVAASVPARMSAPVFVVHEHGSACVLPIRPGPEKRAQFVEDEPAQVEKSQQAEEQKPADDPKPDTAPPVEKPAPDPAREKIALYFFYVKYPGDKKFYMLDLSAGTTVSKKINATCLPGYDVGKLKQIVDHIAALNPDAVFQLRKDGARTGHYTAFPTFTPEEFATRYAA